MQPETPIAEESTAIPLCVDLDGTLVKTDLLWECVAVLLRTRPWLLLLLPFWLLAGRASLKRQISRRVRLKPSSLPVNDELVRYLMGQKALGRKLVLVTGSDELLARSLAAHLGLFDEVIASDGKDNIKGHVKAERLRDRFRSGYDYAGNSTADLPVWQNCRRAILVGGLTAVQRAKMPTSPWLVLPQMEESKIVLWSKALRVHQWLKNLLVFAPLAASHTLLHAELLGRAALAFLAFSLASSGVYVLNDLMDLEADRGHASKRQRPFAAGKLPLSHGFLLAPTLLVGAVAMASFFGISTAGVVLAYLALSLAYSVRLKEIPLLDVFVLSALYSLRMAAGHTVCGVPYSVWLLSFSFLLFLSLAASKRISELQRLSGASESAIRVARRGYWTSDLGELKILSIASGFAASVVITLYLSSSKVQRLYARPEALWLLFPVFLYWISRVWLHACRGSLKEDPLLFALTDRASYAMGLLTGTILVLAAMGWWPALPFEW